MTSPVVLPPASPRLAVRSERASLDHASLRSRVDALAAALAGTPPGTTVAVRLANDPAQVVAVLACLRAGRRAVLVDVLWRAAELAHAASCVRAELVLGDEQVDEPTCAAFGAVAWRLAPDGTLLDAPPVVAGTRRDLEPGLVYWSSGSTGRPKPIEVGNAALRARLDVLAPVAAFTSADRTLCALPLSHCHGIECLALPTLEAGGELHLLDPLAATPARVAQVVRERRITFVSGLPRFWSEVLELGVGADALASLRMAMCGSAALDPDVSRRFHARFGRPIGQGYGLTEIGVVALNQHDGGAPRYASVGPVLPGIEWRLDAPDDDGVGELWVRSAGCAGEDLGPAGWLRTRDLARADADGWLTLVGRRSSFVNRNGAKVDPLEVERVVAGLPWVAECAVGGIAQAGGSERLVAWVVPRSGADVPHPAADVQRHVAEHLALFKVPTDVVLLDALPVGALGKVAHAALPAPALDRAPVGRGPRGELEHEVAALWARVLELDEVPATVGFAELGGTSVRLVELLGLLQERLAPDWDVVDLFRHPTVAAQAARLAGAADADPVARGDARGRAQRRALTRRRRPE